MNFREIIDGSLEPLWRFNARRDADAFKDDLNRSSPSRRQFLAGAGAALLAEYLDTRRAIAFPRGDAVANASIQQITNARTGTIYQYLYQALVGMQSGDTLLLPAGLTHKFSGSDIYYAHYFETNWLTRVAGVSGSGFGSGFLGATGNYGGKLAADYGTIQGVGSINNGRALLTPPFGVLAADYHTTDTEMFFDPSTPVSRFNPAGNFLYVLGSYNFGQFATAQGAYTGLDIPGNGLTGVTANFGATVPAGTIITTYIVNGKGIFFTVGQNPGWTFTNIEFANTAWGDGGGNVVSSVQQGTSDPGGPYVGSMTFNNCYIHDCKQGPGIGYTGIGSVPTFAYFFDTELTQMGAYTGTQSDNHNVYIGHIGELLMDNCYSHNTAGTWLVKSRAALNFLRYCQLLGERTDSNPQGKDNSGTDFSNGGLCYVIGNIHQQSLKAANTIIDFSAEIGSSGSMAGGALNPFQELYAVNDTFVGPSNGIGLNTNIYAGKAPITWNNYGVGNPEIPLLSQGAGGSLPARQYYERSTVIGTGGGESSGSLLNGDVGSGSVWEFLSISANKLITVASPLPRTGVVSWNCYANYNDPILFANVTFPQPQRGNLYFWDAGFTLPVFSQTGGGTTISVTGTLTNGSNSVTGLTSLSGLAALAQLRNLSVYVGGTATGLYVLSVNPATSALTLSGNFAGTTGSATITFGYYLYCGFTYVTALGDSALAAIEGFNPLNPSYSTWYDGSYTKQTGRYINAATIQVDPGNLLVVNAPPSGPAFTTGIRFWARQYLFTSDWGYLGADSILEADIIGLSSQNPTPISFGASWTSPATVITKAQVVDEFCYLQNASPIALGTTFTEPTTGLTNHNPTQSHLQWYRRGALNSGGGTMDCWYTVVPGGGLSGYNETIYLNTAAASTLQGQVSIWRGCAANPFDGNFQSPVQQAAKTASVSTAAGNVTLLAAYRTNTSGTVPSGFTQIGTPNLCNASYASFSGAQTGLSISETSGNAADLLLADALAGTSAAPTLVTSVALSGSGATLSFTIAAANAGDILYLMLAENNIASIAGIGRIGPPPLSTASNASPSCLVQNCLAANFNSSFTSGSLVINAATGAAMPGGAVTEPTNLKANPFNGTTFGSPSWATVFSDPTQSDYVYTLAGGSPAKSAASNPGSSPEGQSLIPTFQTGWSGLPTPGTPIPTKVARTDIGPALTGSIGALA